MFLVQEGFGPFDSDLRFCWSVNIVKQFDTYAEACAFSNEHYESQLNLHFQSQPENVQYYWTRVLSEGVGK